MLSVWGLGKLAKSGHGSTRLHYCDTLHDLNVHEAMAAVGSNNQVDLAVSKGFWVRELETEWQQCADTFQEYFDAKEKEYAAFLGAPSYRGGWGDPDYPEEYVEQSHMEGGVHCDLELPGYPLRPFHRSGRQGSAVCRLFP